MLLHPNKTNCQTEITSLETLHPQRDSKTTSLHNFANSGCSCAASRCVTATSPSTIALMWAKWAHDSSKILVPHCFPEQLERETWCNRFQVSLITLPRTDIVYFGNTHPLLTIFWQFLGRTVVSLPSRWSALPTALLSDRRLTLPPFRFHPIKTLG